VERIAKRAADFVVCVLRNPVHYSHIANPQCIHGACHYTEVVERTQEQFMWHFIAGRCGNCGAKKEWNERECHGCHVKRVPYASILLGFTLTLCALGIVVFGTQA
jgi:hypothetical protein